MKRLSYRCAAISIPSTFIKGLELVLQVSTGDTYAIVEISIGDRVASYGSTAGELIFVDDLIYELLQI